ncbi:carboxypeptidase-like regulatory domain-containing protein [Cystobacter ferrugineus]|uniref:carboxypeptidase-like regulatory domain-containing protein n=1 Tax=Cystobacter ferrugineus TaxID=83449 RepID=UPI000AEB9E2D|nr:carboxypeptidase-like regulatory domain-containing protein [Cystobacter ferrugineus]
MKKHWAVVLPLLVLACGPKDENGDGIADGIRDPDSVSVVAPANPKGTVSGQVLDTAMQPLAGVSVRLTIGSDTAEGKYVVQTDALGNFMFKGVPAGSTVLVTISKEGYATLRASATVPANAGNIPINDANASLGLVMLAKTQSKVSFTLLTDKGQPAVGAQAFLEAYPAGLISAAGTTVQATSTVTAVPAVADAMGVVTFNNMPSPSELTRIGTLPQSSTTTAYYRLWVDPVDVNGDGVIDSGGYASPIDASVLLKSGSQIVTLNPAKNSGGSTAFTLLATNVPSLQLTPTSPPEAKKPMRNLLRPGDPIYLGFSQPVVRDSLIAILTGEQGQAAIELTVTPNETGDAYTLTPAMTNVLEGQEYNLILRATSAYSGAVQTWKGYFVSGDVKTPRPLQLENVTFKDGTTGTPNVLDAGECVILTFNQAVTSTAFQLDALLLNGTDTKPYKALPASYPSAVSACFGSEAVKIPIDTSFQATPRFYFTYGLASDTTLPPINPNSTTARIRVDFSKFQQADFSQYYETAWGAPVPSTTVLERTITPPVR